MSPYFQFANWLTGQWWYWAGGGVLFALILYLGVWRKR